MSASYNMVSLIERKRNGDRWTNEEIEHVVTAVCRKTIQESQIGALLMAVRLKDMDTEETVALTTAMINSGRVLGDLWPNEWRHLVVDKHSTGGVGDKVSLVLAPALAACGLKVPMISGRSLGHTGGTLDKLESIPGYDVIQSADAVVRILNEVGCCIVGQTDDLVPADRIIYGIRDVTATVDSIPLIVASILSKKVAEGLRALVLDIKVGKGAMSNNEETMRRLAKALVSTGNRLNTKTTGFLTSMNSPIGKTVGNALEVAETIECLQGQGSRSLVELITKQGGQLLSDAQLTASSTDGERRIAESLTDGSALERFKKMIIAQGVDSKKAEELCRKGADIWTVLPKADIVSNVIATTSGYLSEIDALTCANVCRDLGAGRTMAGQVLDFAVGLEIVKELGDFVREGDVVMKLHHTRPLDPRHLERLRNSISVDKYSHVKYSLILEQLTS